MTLLYSAITDFVTGRSLLEGDRAVCIVLDLRQEPRAIYYPTDMASIASLPITGRVGEDDNFVPDLDDYSATMFEHVIQSTWNAYSSKAARGPAAYEIKNHFTDHFLLSNAYVSEGTFQRLVEMARPHEGLRDEAWAAAEIYHDAHRRYRKGERSDIMRLLSMDTPMEDEWLLADGRTIPIPDIMRRFNSNECQLKGRLRLTMTHTMRAADTVFDNEIGYRKLAELQAFSVGLFKIGKHFQPSRKSGDANLAENAHFLIGELRSLIASAHLDSQDIEDLTAKLADVLPSVKPQEMSR
ncbi:hypothetical protein G6L37_06620 [Agrobacterium rubi]|nr:hypothetical protein [Agrobacterium rubi]NTF25037.1 hypothetical protein [Agrobacterium rubi]